MKMATYIQLSLFLPIDMASWILLHIRIKITFSTAV